MGYRKWGIPAAAVALSAVLRLLYFLQIRANPYFFAPVMDEGYHDQWAQEIAAGNWAFQLPFFRAPFYPTLLGLAYRLPGGPDFELIRGAQLALGAFTPAMVWLIARRLVPGKPAIWAGAAFLTAADVMLAYFEADLLLEALLAPLSALLMWFVLRAGATGAAGRWAAAGLALGLFAVTRPNVLLFAPVLFLVALGWAGERFSLRAFRWRAGLALTLGTCLVVLPVTFVNWKWGGDPVLIASQGGLNFFLGNNDEANGWSATAPSLFRVDWWGGYEDAIRLAEEAEGRSLTASEVSDHWFDRGFAWWAENPGAGMAITMKKAVFLLSGVEFGNNRDPAHFFEEFVPWGMPFLYFLYVMTPLALLGAVVLAARGSPGAWTLLLYLLVYSLSVILFFVTARYRVPLRPLLAVLAVVGVHWLWVGMRTRPGRAALALGGVAVFAVAANGNPWVRAYDPSPAQFYQSVASVYRSSGNLTEALRWQIRTVEEDPTYPEGNLNLGTMYMETGDPAAAITAFEAERAADPTDAKNLASLAQALQRVGRTEEAAARYAEAESLGLEDAPA
ncbi:MAG: hypothetical protein HKN12_05380, partial [Gemmatimonadetes bacterium]|nr:hypothetical protein [Gemmatimonadota bacterium]